MNEKHSERQSGIAAVEFGLLLPVFVLVLFGIVEFGMAFYRQQVLTGAVREGGRMGIVATTPRPSSTQIEAAVNAYLQGAGFDLGPADVTVTGAGGVSGSALTVTATYPTSFSVLSNFVPNLEAEKTLQASIVMQLE